MKNYRMKHWTKSGLTRFGVPAALVASLAACGGESASAGILPGGERAGAVAALGYDRGTDRLLKVQGNAVHQSADGGATWQPVALPSAVAQGSIAAVATADSGRVLYIAGPGIGVFQSTDAGRTWVSQGEQLPSRDVMAFAVHADQPETLYASLADGIHRSEDAGKTWKKIDGGPGEGIRKLFHSDMPGSMQTGWLFAVTPEGVRRSMDCFCGWRPTGALPAGEVHDIAYDPSEPKRVYVSTSSGIFRSEDGGESWETAASSAVTALIVDKSGTLYAAAGDGRLVRSTDQGRSWDGGA